MKDGYIRLAAASPEVKVADCISNGERIKEMIFEAAEKKAAVIVFPELAITGYTCGDLFRERTLLGAAQEELMKLMDETADLDILCAVGMPVPYMGSVYNAAAVFKGGELLGLPAKKNIPGYSEFYETRNFTGAKGTQMINFCGFTVPFGENIVFSCVDEPDLAVSCEIAEDLWAAESPSAKLASAGATVILNLSCTDETVGKADYRRMMTAAASGKTITAYAYADSGIGESTSDMIFAGHRMIAENAAIVSEDPLFTSGICYGDVDIQKLIQERRRMNTWNDDLSDDVTYVSFGYEEDTFADFKIERNIDPSPFLPAGCDREERCRSIIKMQTVGLATRLRHIHAKTAVVGLSGGLDSTLALLITVNAFDEAGLDRKGIKAITMPCFGTTGRTKSNAQVLAENLGVDFSEISIEKSVLSHFEDIGHSYEEQDVTFENAQARERTQVLMDYANKINGIVIGTGDLSELALGWATYNGDHMSMYGVNGGIPKTLVRHLVKYAADTQENVKEVLYDILDTPVSPELLPPKDGEIAQKTENIVGPYELHDFFIYYMLRYGFTPEKIYHMAQLAFDGVYDDETIKKWLKTFYRRFFTQQFKRSCLPDGPKVGSVALSPRGDLRMPSDACGRLWTEMAERL